MVTTFSPPPGSQAPSSPEVEMEWEPTTSEDVAPRLPLDRGTVIPDSQEDQDDVFSPLPKGTMIPDSEEDSNMTFTHVLAKRLNEVKCLSYIHPLRLIHQMHLSDLGAENESDIRALVLKPTTLLPEPPATFRDPVVPDLVVQGIIARLMQKPKLCHVAWGRALEGLEAMAAAAAGPLDALGILEELNNAKDNCEGDWETLAEPARAASDDTEVLLVEPRVTKWVAQFMCCLIGVDADPQSDEKWWTGDSQPREAAAAVGEDLYMRIDQTFRRLMAGHVVKVTRTAPGLTPAAEAERDAKAHDLAGRALA
ncbi:hypothetical protein NCS57_01199900 [Fusarium keratoplasticum]|uniref:Uncharacterized protein n=1 Tax=Fusarium keratoplasticum TaxID=1328300 RepID=A0ACC0QJP8_9HYPO|nr:hypothetical protein NCS57_01199900 [Fusarium keratoplasticum]KAI8654536.1 hypothetical protein NCS57_01199900 [Fusarium keratoplasticum]